MKQGMIVRTTITLRNLPDSLSCCGLQELLDQTS